MVVTNAKLNITTPTTSWHFVLKNSTSPNPNVHPCIKNKIIQTRKTNIVIVNETM